MPAANDVIETWWTQKKEDTETILLNAGVTSQWWTLSLDGTGVLSDVEDIRQSIDILFKTFWGEDAHRPFFASKLSEYLDRPVPQAAPFIVREVSEAFRQWEPRVEVLSLRVIPGYGGATAVLVWSVRGGDSTFTSEVLVSGRS